jgi:hypothetical protein
MNNTNTVEKNMANEVEEYFSYNNILPKPEPTYDNNLLLYKLCRTANGKFAKTKYNLHLIISLWGLTKGCLKYDEFDGHYIIFKDGKWKHLDDRHILHLLNKIEDTFDVRFTQSQIDNVVTSECIKNPFNSIQHQFKNLPKWDGKPRLATLLIDYMGADKALAESIGVMTIEWFVSTVRKVFEPYKEVSKVLVLVGNERAGKEDFINEIFLISYYYPRNSILLNLKRGYSESEIEGYLCITLEKGKNKLTEKELEKLKELSKGKQIYAGTAHSYDIFPDDPMFLKVEISIDNKTVENRGVQHIVNQLWAEAYSIYKAK